MIKEEISCTNRELDRWILAAGKGDRDALRDLYTATSPAIYLYALSIVQNPHDAEDVLQDCFLTVQSSGSYRSQGKPMGWLITVARNLCLRRLGERNRACPLPEGDLFGAADPNPEQRLILESCLRLLNDEERQIVILHAVAGFKHREIAAHMGLKLNTVLTKYRRAIQTLKDILRKELLS